MTDGKPRATAILISPHFPPSTVAGVHRARHLAKHLPAFGWRPIVLRADASTYTETNDPALAELAPKSVEQVSVGALPAGLMRGLGVGDIGIRAYPYLRRALDRLVDTENPSLVFITGFPFYPMMLAGRIKRHHRLPVVLDFQDPWVSDFGASQPAFSKQGLAHRLAGALEPRALRHADYVTSVSDVQNQAMADRYPWLNRDRMAAIPIGGDPEDFDALRDLERPGADVLRPGHLNLSYVGAFLPRAGPLARVLFRALAQLRRNQPMLTERVQLNFVGTSNQTNGAGGARVTPIAVEEGVGDLVHEVPERIPYLEALSILANSDGLLLIGSDEPHYTASKIYPALMAARPYVSIFHAASSAHAILSRAGGGLTYAFESQPELDALAPALTAGLARLLEQPKTLGAPDPKAYAPYTASAVSGQFAALFDRVVGAAP